VNPEVTECIKQFKREIRRLEREVRICIRERDFKYAKHYQKALWRTQKELDRFNSFTDKNHYVDEQEIDEALIELHEGAIKGFSLILQPHQDFYLDFSHSDDDLIYCRLPTEEELNQAYVYLYRPKSKRSIAGLGFREVGPDRRLSRKFVLPADHSCTYIKAQLSVLMFEVLYIDIRQPFHWIKRNNEAHHPTVSSTTTGPPGADPGRGATVCVDA
jgi:hypothetical protein